LVIIILFKLYANYNFGGHLRFGSPISTTRK
jgi:hypothetical protein